ncbi:MAG: TRAP transporter substrate-binding protein DctP [Chloroflexi bacterium]|nr:TRAP transporter substrate-binding protein DctP [Chloroflexota bacterium]
MKSLRVVRALVLAVFALVLGACAGAPTATPATTGPQKTVTLKFASALPEQDAQLQAILTYLHDVEERTKKSSVAVKFDLFLSGQLYNANQIPGAVAEGGVDIGHTYSAVIGPDMVPAFDILRAPLIWTDEAHMQRALNGELGQILSAELEKRNLKTLWYQWFGSFEWFGRDKPIVRPEDVKGLRLRSLGTMDAGFYQALGASSVNVPSTEQYSAFQRGIADGLISDYGTVQSRKLYEVLKYGTKGGKLEPNSNPLPINLDTWKSLPKDTQDAFLAAAKVAGDKEVSRLDREYGELASDLQAKGMQIVQMSDADRKAWFAYRKTIEDAYVKSAGDLGRQILDIVEKYR